MPHLSKPLLFIGSSTESINLANAIDENLKNKIQCEIWTDTFPLSHNTVDSLLTELHKCDFAAFILSPDDTAVIRKIDYTTARDNLFYEAGLATGIFGKDRCFLVIAKDDPNFRIPSDLMGITLATYEKALAESDPKIALEEVCKSINQAIDQSLWKNVKIETTFNHKRENDPNIYYKSKLFFYVTNEEKHSLTIELGRIQLNNITIDPVHKVYGNKKYYQPSFFIEQIDKKEIWNYTFTFSSRETKYGWIPIDPKYSDAEIKDLLNKDQVGSFFYKGLIDKDHPIIISHNLLF